MFSIAVLIGVYVYLIFGLGIVHLLFPQIVLFLTLVFFLCLSVYYKKLWLSFFQPSYLRTLSKPFINEVKRSRVMILSLCLLTILASINFLGALGPEYAFDALWYHLTLPKLYVMSHSIQHISGGLLYYSNMPRFGEIIYALSLLFGNEIIGKIIHWFVGLLVVGITYHSSKKMLGKKWALLAALLFYSNIVISWESTTAYIDLFRAFFELLAFWGFLHWIETKKKQWVIESAVMVGLAIGTKTLAIGSLAIFSSLIIYEGYIKSYDWKSILQQIGEYCLVALLIPMPWFITAFLSTGNPFYPIFSNYEVHQTIWQVLNPIRFVTSIWMLFTHADDPVNPIYLILLPLSFIVIPQVKKIVNLLIAKSYGRQTKRKEEAARSGEIFVYIYSLIALVIWYITPQTGGGRFIVAYLPVLSIASVLILKKIVSVRLKNAMISLLIFLSVVTIFYRGVATMKYMPYLIGKESKDAFLTHHLNFSYGDFYDTDDFFQKNIKPSDTVLLYGFHNLYYVNFPFIDSSWVKRGDRFTYVAVQNTKLPKRFSFWELIYSNPVTHVSVYTFNHKQWIY